MSAILDPFGLIPLLTVANKNRMCTDEQLAQQCPRFRGAGGGTDASTDMATNVQETSSGFHIFELHLPTVGAGASAIVLAVIVAVFIFFWVKYCRANRRRLRQAEAAIAGTEMSYMRTPPPAYSMAAPMPAPSRSLPALTLVESTPPPMSNERRLALLP